MPLTLAFLQKYKGDRHVYVETGLGGGKSLGLALDAGFNPCFSVEIDPAQFAQGWTRYRSNDAALIYQGDSAEVLPEILTHVTEPAVFWLDAHHGGHDSYSPLLKELEAIKAHSVKGHVILIDDVRCLEPFWHIKQEDIASRLAEGASINRDTADPDYPNDVLVIAFPPSQ